MEEGESPSFLHHTWPQITESDNDSISGAIGKDSGGFGLRKGKEPHWAAEEEEESSDESLKLISVAQYREAKDSTPPSGDYDPHPLGLGEELSAAAENDSNGAEEGGKSTHIPASSQSSMVLSGHSGDFDLPVEGIASNLETADRALEFWKDREALLEALPKLAEKSHDPQLDLILWAHLAGIKGVLNLYLDPKLKYFWTNASIMVVTIEGCGVNCARNLRQWILTFVQYGELPVHHLGQTRWDILDDEDVSHSLQSLLLSHTKGCYITAIDVVELVSGPVMQEKFSQSGISRPSISERTGRRWLQHLSWRYGPSRNGMYLDGHEREDVVAYGDAFVARWKVYEKRFHTWDNDGIESLPQNAFPVQGGLFHLILVTHDASVFYQNDFRKTHWIASTSKATPLPKGDGQSITISDFLTSEWGRLVDGAQSVFNSLNKTHFILTILLFQRSKGCL